MLELSETRSGFEHHEVLQKEAMRLLACSWVATHALADVLMDTKLAFKARSIFLLMLDVYAVICSPGIPGPLSCTCYVTVRGFAGAPG